MAQPPAFPSSRPDHISWMLRLSDTAALTGIAVTSALFWILIVVAVSGFPLSPLLLVKGMGIAFASTILFAWISGHIRDTAQSHSPRHRALEYS